MTEVNKYRGTLTVGSHASKCPIGYYVLLATQTKYNTYLNAKHIFKQENE